MSTHEDARNLAHQITTEAAAPMRAIRDLAAELGLGEKEVTAYLAKIAYRRAYNMRPEVVAARRVRNQERAAVQKAITAKLKAAGRVELLNKLAETMVK